MTIIPSGPTPLVALTTVPEDFLGRMTLHAKLTTAAATQVALLFQSRSTSRPGRPYLADVLSLETGENDLYVDVPVADVTGALIVHLTPTEGPMLLQDLEARVRAVPSGS